MFYSPPLSFSLSRRVCLLKAPSGREKRRRERKDNASQNGGGRRGEEDVEDAKRKSKEISKRINHPLLGIFQQHVPV